MESAINGSCSSVWEFYPKENKVYFSEKIYEITGYNPGSFDNTLEWIKKIIIKNGKNNTELVYIILKT